MNTESAVFTWLVVTHLFSHGAITEMEHGARALGLTFSVESGRGWFRRSHLIKVIGPLDLLQQWIKIWKEERINGQAK